jgi:predicted protein tyrosine phosphatase
MISIHDPDKRPANVPRQTGLRGVLVLSFHDADPTAYTTLSPEVRVMTPDQAAKVWDFIDQHRADVGAIVVHCEGGFSRSPAVAAAIAEGLGLDPRRFWQEYTPNQHVYHTMLDSFEARRANRK